MSDEEFSSHLLAVENMKLEKVRKGGREGGTEERMQRRGERRRAGGMKNRHGGRMEGSINLPVFLTLLSSSFFPTVTMAWSRTRDSARRRTDTGVRSSSAATTFTERSGTSLFPFLPPFPPLSPSFPSFLRPFCHPSFFLSLIIPLASLPPTFLLVRWLPSAR